MCCFAPPLDGITPDALLAFLGSIVQLVGTVSAAIIVGVAGGLITVRYSREKDRQDKESQWRQHAIELTKLDLQRKLGAKGSAGRAPIRPSVLDFLANYRDLKELDTKSPKDLYLIIERDRISRPPKARRTTPKRKRRRA